MDNCSLLHSKYTPTQTGRQIMNTATRTAAQQAAYDRMVGTAQTVREQQEQGVSVHPYDAAQDAAPAPVVHVDRTTVNSRGRAATVFVDAPLTSAPGAAREAVEVHLLPGEFAQFDCIRRTGDPAISRFEFAIFA